MITKSKSKTKWKLQVEQSSRTMINHDKNVVAGCGIMYIRQLPKHCMGQDFVNPVLYYVLGKLQHSHVDVILARYYESHKEVY